MMIFFLRHTFSTGKPRTWTVFHWISDVNCLGICYMQVVSIILHMFRFFYTKFAYVEERLNLSTMNGSKQMWSTRGSMHNSVVFQTMWEFTVSMIGLRRESAVYPQKRKVKTKYSGTFHCIAHCICSLPQEKDIPNGVI